MLQKIFMNEDWYQLNDLPKAIDNNILRSKQIIFFTDGMMDKIKVVFQKVCWKKQYGFW